MALCFIIPPHILDAVAQNGTPEQKEWVAKTREASKKIRQQRYLQIQNPKTQIATPLRQGFEGQAKEQAVRNRIIYTDNDGTTLPGTEIGTEAHPPTDLAGKEAFNGTGATWDLYQTIYNRNSIDNKGLPLISTVHYSEKYDNAFWDGQQMVYGDGDGQLFGLFTRPIDVTGHELTHGVTQYSANLTYQDQSGALNESFSDVFGILVKQYSLHQTAQQADWLIGEGILEKSVKGVALRSMKAPGTAYDDPVLGKDPQPADMSHFISTADDNGGVHINSGIPNHAFYLAAVGIGGFAWEKSGLIWYKTLIEKLAADASFLDCAKATILSAQELFGDGSHEMLAVDNAWKMVGVI